MRTGDFKGIRRQRDGEKETYPRLRMAPATANSLLLSTISLQIYILLIRTSPPDWIDRHIRCKYIFMPTKNLVPSSNLMLGFVVVVLLLTKEDTRTSEPIVVFDAASLTETARIGFWWCHWSHVLQTQALCLVLFVCVVASCLPACAIWRRF